MVVVMRLAPGEPIASSVSFRPEAELYASGNEPLYLIRSLQELCPVSTRLDFDPDGTPGARLTWTFDFAEPIKRERIEEVFEFVDGVCQSGNILGVQRVVHGLPGKIAGFIRVVAVRSQHRARFCQ